MIWVGYFITLIVISAVAIIVQRRKKHDISVTNFEAPIKLDRNDFKDYASAYIVVVFSSQACNSCEGVVAKANVLQSDVVDVVNVDYTTTKGKALHKKYEIEAVPTTVICDVNGVVQESFIGSVTATDLWAALAKVRGAHIQSCDSHT